MKTNKTIFVFIGPSGAGKTTLIDAIRDELNIPNLITHTTRNKRPGEVNGKNYHFVSIEEFNKLDKIEYAKYSGNYYGLSKNEIDEKLKYNDKVLITQEKNGALKTKEVYGDNVKIIYLYVSLDTMKQRMKDRGDSEKAIAQRIKNALESKEFDNINIADYVLINEDGMLKNNIELFKTILKLT